MFPNSTILTQEMSIKLLNIAELPNNKNYTLRYQASKDRFNGFVFHNKTDGLINSLFIIKTSSTGNVYGGFISQDMTCNIQDCYLYDENAFMFSLTNNLNVSFRMKIINPKIPIQLFPFFSSNLPYFFLDSYQKPDYINGSISQFFGTNYEQIEIYSFDRKFNFSK